MAFLKRAEGGLVHAHVLDGAGERALVEQTDDDLLPMDRGQNGDTQIDFLAGDADAEAPVLREAALGDIQAGENLDAGGDRQLERLGRRTRLDQRAIDAVAQLERLLEGLDVNIGSLFLERLHEDEVDDLDDGRVLALVRQPVQVDLLALLGDDLGFAGFLGHLLDHLLHLVAGAVDPAQRLE